MMSAKKKGNNKYSFKVDQKDLNDTEWYKRIDEDLKIHSKNDLY